MPELPKQFKPYSEKRAEKEASKMEEKIKTGEANGYNEAEKLVEQEKRDKKFDFTKDEDKKRFKKLPEDKRKNLIDEVHAVSLVEDERMETDKEIRAENHKKYGHFKDYVYEMISEVFEGKGLSTRAWRKKIIRYHRLPPEVVFIFKKLESENISVNDLSPDLLKETLNKTYALIDREDEYDKELAQRIGHSELLRWRNNEELQNGDSFQKIVATLREHAVVKAPKTKIGQKPKVTFKPKGEYHKKENL
ncbi:hypothetical protein BMS3Abin15_00350 [bacterium BMS3Abin15]|nr:hypothetical protein BMS3Abin15_00350 [bacterium BMS3Abin15]